MATGRRDRGETQQGRVDTLLKLNKCMLKWGEIERQAEDSVINYINVCLDGQKQK